MARAWLFQDPRQKEKLGEEMCPWSVGWIDPANKRKSRRIGSKSRAEKYARKIEGELAAGVYEDVRRKTWQEVREEYEQKALASTSPGNRSSAATAFGHFERIIGPHSIRSVTTATIDNYRSRRLQEKGMRGGRVSPATLNRELRHLRALFRKARKWKYITELPDFDMEREPRKRKPYVTPEHFTAIYNACEAATRPKGLPYPTGDWWRALLVFCYMTGWRISEPLALRREDLNLEEATALTRHTDNKGRRDEVHDLPAAVAEHLARIRGFDELVFPWPHRENLLWTEFQKIQKAAGITLPCHEKHNHTDACHFYGFHALRRAFATENCAALSAEELQRLMRHRDYKTTQGYINFGRKMKEAAAKVHVPDVLRKVN